MKLKAFKERSEVAATGFYGDRSAFVEVLGGTAAGHRVMAYMGFPDGEETRRVVVAQAPVNGEGLETVVNILPTHTAIQLGRNALQATADWHAATLNGEQVQ